MNSLKINHLISIALGILFIVFIPMGCSKDILNEVPPSNLSPEQVLSSKAGFNNYLNAIYVGARNELNSIDGSNRWFDEINGTDVATSGDPGLINYRNYDTYQTPTTGSGEWYWNWAYQQMIAKANMVIIKAQTSDASLWINEADRNYVIAQAKFFRGYAYNFLANLFGGVPLSDTIHDGPKVDFVRSTRKETWEFAKNDLIYASQWLPATVAKADEGHVVKAAADHLLTEVYISLGEYDNAIASASAVINSGLYNLMTTRFGSDAANPGDPFSDLFKDGNQNRSSGNRESIYVMQIEDVTPGGQGPTNLPGGGDGNTPEGVANNWIRAWGPRYFDLRDPTGKPGMVVCDSMLRGVGWIRPNTYTLYDVWGSQFDTDMRNSTYNIRRVFAYNNNTSTYYGQIVGPRNTSPTANQDTMQFLYPVIRKIEGKIGKTSNNASGKTFKDIMMYRLAETYLLRAEAYLGKGDLVKAAADINVVRARANVSPVAPAAVNIDYILDERIRELITEEPRRRTLSRMNKLVERTRKYNMNSVTRGSIKTHHELLPIPQVVIDRNFGIKMDQNPGY